MYINLKYEKVETKVEWEVGAMNDHVCSRLITKHLLVQQSSVNPTSLDYCILLRAMQIPVKNLFSFKIKVIVHIIIGNLNDFS